MNIEGLSLEWNVSKMCVLQLATGEGDLCAGDVGTHTCFLCFLDGSLILMLSTALSYPLGCLFSSNRVTKEVDSNSKEAKSFLKQQEKLQSAAPASLPTVSGWVWDFPTQYGPLVRKMALKPIVQALQYLMGVCFLEGFSGSKTRPGRCDDLGWREATREFQWLTS